MSQVNEKPVRYRPKNMIEHSKTPRLRPAPEELASQILVINMVPATTELPDFTETIIIDSSDYALRENDDISATVELHGTMVTCLDKLPSAFTTYLWSRSFVQPYHAGKQPTGISGENFDSCWLAVYKKCFRPWPGTDWLVKYFQEGPMRRPIDEYMALTSTTWEDAIDSYRAVILGTLREYNFVQIAQKRLRNISQLNELARQCGYRGRSLWVEGRIGLITDEAGIVRDERDRFAQALTGVDLQRIRQCAVCRKILWAGRNDAMCCSPQCANARRTRLYRKRKGEIEPFN